MSALDVIFFDLDGTLVDTAPDLAFALNQLLQEQGHAPLAYDLIRPMASHGSAGLLGLGFGVHPNMPEYQRLQQRFLRLYQDNISRHSQLFDGMQDTLKGIENAGLKWGVITNKPAFLTQPLMADLQLTARAVCIVSGDTVAKAKPDPLPMLHACDLAHVDPQRCLYIGDAERDIMAGRNAGMRTVVAAYGYLADEDQPTSWQADAIINHPSELSAWF